ncbi:hypothetical protein JVU11DRAFT_10130 [Chiua virens]|nr:hypothetical protein JVU11DRAFT_10130 [Chiua virens]
MTLDRLLLRITGSSNRDAHTQPQTAVLPHRPWNANLPYVGVPTAPMSARNRAPLRTAVMPHRPSDVVLFPVSKSPSPVRQQVDDRTLNAEYAACHPDDDPGIDERHQTLLQQLPVSHSPVTRLPPEILMRVFELYAAASRGELTPFHLVSGPFYLMQVCKLWSAVTELDHHLWTSIDISFPESCPHQDEDTSKVKAMLDLHLKRSAALPISITFTDLREWYAPTEEAVISLLADYLRTHAHRWKSITLHMSDHYFLRLFKFTPCNLACLEHLSINMSWDRATRTLPRVRFPLLNLESAPNLKSFAYSGLDQSFIDDVRLNWEDLTEVSFDFTPHRPPRTALGRNIRVLARCQNITTCFLGIKDSVPDRAPNQIFLPNLRTLHVRRLAHIGYVRHMIDTLVLPQLQTLDITIDACCCDVSGWTPRSSQLYRDFSRLLAHSRCSLSHLSIQDSEFPTDDVVRCLALSPMLTSFCFIPNGRSYDVGDVIRKLNVSHIAAGANWTLSGQGKKGDVDGVLVPQLRDITLGSSTQEHLELMMAMFRSRSDADAHAAGVASLRRVKVVFVDVLHGKAASRERTLGRLARFRKDLSQWASKYETGREGEEGLEASVVEESPYNVRYVDIR